MRAILAVPLPRAFGPVFEGTCEVFDARCLAPWIAPSVAHVATIGRRALRALTPIAKPALYSLGYSS